MSETIGVVVTGIGVVSPLGCSLDALVRRFADESEEGDNGSSLLIADIPLDGVPADKRARIGRLDRLCRVFLSASHLAVDAAGLRIGNEDSERVGLSFGTGFGCLLTNAEYYQKIVETGPAAASPRLFAYTVSSAAAGEVSIALAIKGPNATAHMGFAAGLGAVGYAFDWIQTGKADIVLAGGADVGGPALIAGLRDMGLLKTREQARPFADSVPGVWPSEGAVVCVLEREEHARRRGARVWGRIDGYAAGFEPTLTRRMRESTGIVAAMRRALRLSGHAADAVDVVMSSAHGTPIDAVEREAMAKVFGGRDLRVRTPKVRLGETFAASGVVSLALALGTPEIQNERGASVVMVNALCYSGTIVSLLARSEP
ncbi:MAG TPA: beta-ketoacyl synthase N-terminal-like domain-containing protein [Candidatus Binatia bacterium]|nr:beta-ketoacyl synthase N-terminal-like domain-containing protein [Candidatus Binatia bacterium]